MFMLLSSRHPVHLMNVERRQAAAEAPTQDQARRLSLSQPVQAVSVYTYHRHLLLLLSPKADTYSTVP